MKPLQVNPERKDADPARKPIRHFEVHELIEFVHRLEELHGTGTRIERLTQGEIWKLDGKIRAASALGQRPATDDLEQMRRFESESERLTRYVTDNWEKLPEMFRMGVSDRMWPSGPSLRFIYDSAKYRQEKAEESKLVAPVEVVPLTARQISNQSSSARALLGAPGYFQHVQDPTYNLLRWSAMSELILALAKGGLLASLSSRHRKPPLRSSSLLYGSAARACDQSSINSIAQCPCDIDLQGLAPFDPQKIRSVLERYCGIFGGMMQGVGVGFEDQVWPTAFNLPAHNAKRLATSIHGG